MILTITMEYINFTNDNCEEPSDIVSAIDFVASACDDPAARRYFRSVPLSELVIILAIRAVAKLAPGISPVVVRLRAIRLYYDGIHSRRDKVTQSSADDRDKAIVPSRIGSNRRV